MSTVPSILYAPRHQAISAFLEVVVSTPDYVDDGDIREFGVGTKFSLKVATRRPPYPDRTEWVCLGVPVVLGSASSDMVAFLRSIWPDTSWVTSGQEVIWVPARPVSDDVEDDLLRAYFAERSSNFLRR